MNERVRLSLKALVATLAFAILVHLAQFFLVARSDDAIAAVGLPFVFARWGGFAPPPCCAYQLDLQVLAADVAVWLGVAVVAAFITARYKRRKSAHTPL